MQSLLLGVAIVALGVAACTSRVPVKEHADLTWRPAIDVILDFVPVLGDAGDANRCARPTQHLSPHVPTLAMWSTNSGPALTGLGASSMTSW